MIRRLLMTAATVLAVAFVPVWSAAQDPNWTPPRTPWGDPDIQGRFTNQSENGTPMERPAEFEGLQLDDFTEEELRELKAAAEADTVERFDGPLHAPGGWWQPDLNMVNGHQAWLVVEPADGRIPPLTAAAEDRIEQQAAARRLSGRGPADSWIDRSLYDRCITRGLPGSMMPAIYGNSYRIVQGPGFVGIMYEMIHEARIIPIVDAPNPEEHHVGSDIRQYMGDAFGYWEGDTLVVETRNFKDGATYRNANADTLRIVERFTRIAPDKVQWAVTMDDPETWTEPWTYTMPLSTDTTFETPEYSCHEGNYGLMNILSAARAREAAEAEADAN
jgi:hypothetical protein